MVGAGPAGAVAAIVAARRGLHIALTGTARNHRRSIEMLGPQAVQILRELDLFDDLEAIGANECPGVRTVWQDGDAVRRSIFDPDGAGWIVERQSLDRMLVSAARRAGAEVDVGNITSVAAEDGGWRIANGQIAPLAARTLLVATGRGQRIARQVGVDYRTDGDEVTLLAKLDRVGEAWRNDPLLLVERTAHGWMYGLPLRGDAVVGITMDPALLAGRRLETAWLETAPSCRTYHRFYVGSALKHVWALPSGPTYAQQPVGANWAVAGDAALSSGPISGQGLSFALESGLRAANFLAERATAQGYAEWVADEQLRYSMAWHHFAEV